MALAGALALLVLAGASALTARQDRQRELAAADRFDLRVSAGGTGVTYDEGLLRLTFALDNRGPAVRLGVPRLQSPSFTLLPSRPLPPVAEGAAALLVLRVRPECGQLGEPRGLQLELPVVPPSGREHLLTATVDEPLMLALARRGCGRG